MQMPSKIFFLQELTAKNLSMLSTKIESYLSCMNLQIPHINNNWALL